MAASSSRTARAVTTGFVRCTRCSNPQSTYSGPSLAASTSSSSVFKGKLKRGDAHGYRRAAFSTSSRQRQLVDSEESIRNAVRIRDPSELYNLSGHKGRLVINNHETAKKIVNAMRLDEMEKPATVIDLYAGRGYLSQALLDHPNVERVIAVDHGDTYASDLGRIVETNPGRMDHIALDPFWWDTYGIMKERGLLQHLERAPWKQKHPQLVVTGFIPNNLNGERLIIQQLSCTVGEMWLYDYGRFSSYFMISDGFKERLMAPLRHKKRHKTAVLLDASVTVQTLLPSDVFQPQADHFEGVWSGKTNRIAKITRNHGYSFVRFDPRTERMFDDPEDLAILEFLAKNFFIHKRAPWNTSLKYLAPGAWCLENIVKRAGHLIPKEKRPSDLEAEEWRWLVEAFKSWPFRPTDLDQSDVLDAESNAHYDKKM